MRISLLILSVLLVVSCTKKGEDAKSRQEILRESKWQFDTGSRHMIWIQDGLSVPVNVDQVVPIGRTVCNIDDRLEFREGYKGAHLTGELICSVNETAEIEFTWGITDNDRKMYIYDAHEFFAMDVNAEFVEFYNNRFTIRYYDVTDKQIDNGNGTKTWVQDSTIYTMTFSAN